MFRLDVDVDDLTAEGLDAVLSVLFDDFKGKFTTDWAITGPVIERLGVTLNYTPPTEDPSTRLMVRARKGEEPEEEACWTADYGGEYESHAKPLVAVVKALIKSKMSGYDLPLPAEVAVKYLKRQSTAVGAVLEGSDYHDVEQFGDDINTYSLTPTPDCMEEFQTVVRVVKQLPNLHIIEEREDAEGTGGFDMLIVKYAVAD
jgi:hypothetical protein